MCIEWGMCFCNDALNWLLDIESLLLLGWIDSFFVRKILPIVVDKINVNVIMLNVYAYEDLICLVCMILCAPQFLEHESEKALTKLHLPFWGSWGVSISSYDDVLLLICDLPCRKAM